MIKELEDAERIRGRRATHDNDASVPWWAWLLIAAACPVIGFGASSWGCSSKAAAMGIESSYGPLKGCMIRVDRKWIPIESYRVLGGPE